MKRQSISFSCEMVKAILDGSKTQTRIRMNPQPKNEQFIINLKDQLKNGDINRKNVFIYKNDKLWVFEPWVTWRVFDQLTPNEIVKRFGAQDCYPFIGYLADQDIQRNGLTIDGKARSSIYMPQWASRILLKVTDVRIEQLQSITEEDILKEGIKAFYTLEDPSELTSKGQFLWGHQKENAINTSPIAAYQHLWREKSGSHNGQNNWELNRWVWVVDFKVIHVKPPLLESSDKSMKALKECCQ